MTETGIPQGDPNMMLALLFARGLGTAPALPASLQDVATRAELVARIDGPFIEWASFEEVVAALARRLAELARATADSMPDVPDALDRVNIVLRLWSGCLSAAKTIAKETRSGLNTPELRADAFASFDALAHDDPIFAAGMEAAPAFKKLRDQPYSFDGVPEDSPVRRYAERSE